jgi:predicted glutamine amidotransferase
VQQTNCHPFRHGPRLFVHNGYVGDFGAIRRDLMLAIDPGLFEELRGTTDTEIVFLLALTLGLERDPIDALEQTVGVIEAAATRRGVTPMVQASFGGSDGTDLWAVRYATSGPARSLYASADAEAIRHLHPENARFQRLTPDDRLIVSEPFSDLPGVWNEIPQGTAVIVRRGGVLEHTPFRPQAARPTESLQRRTA